MPKLTTRQKRTIVALLREPTHEAAADSAGIASRTLRNWLQQPAFTQALAEAEAEAVRDAARGIAGGAIEAAAYLRAVVANEGAETRERIAAARILLARLPDFRLAVLEERMAEMEAGARGP